MLKLMLITNDPETAHDADISGVDWIFIDLEIIGKVERQGGLDTVISKHEIDDIKKIKHILTKSKLLVRINPINANSVFEIDSVISYGADIVMLPYFKTKEEVTYFLELVNKRAKTCLLLETKEAVEKLDEILTLPSIDYIHIGLNDLQISYGYTFMFEPLINGKLVEITRKINKTGIEFGFGGVSRLDSGLLPSNLILSEHYRVGSKMVILSRSFAHNIDLGKSLGHEIGKIRDYEIFLQQQDSNYFDNNHDLVVTRVKQIIKG